MSRINDEIARKNQIKNLLIEDMFEFIASAHGYMNEGYIKRNQWAFARRMKEAGFDVSAWEEEAEEMHESGYGWPEGWKE